MGILGAMGVVKALDRHIFIGELSLDGAIRPVRGSLSIAVCAREQGIANLIVPAENAAEAAVVEGVNVYGVRYLAEVVALLTRPAWSVSGIANGKTKLPGSMNSSAIRKNGATRVRSKLRCHQDL
jgi:predicted ATPase with chaperone activity